MDETIANGGGLASLMLLEGIVHSLNGSAWECGLGSKNAKVVSGLGFLQVQVFGFGFGLGFRFWFQVSGFGFMFHVSV